MTLANPKNQCHLSCFLAFLKAKPDPIFDFIFLSNENDERSGPPESGVLI
jgi:hypothetical protein